MPIDCVLFCDTGIEFPQMYEHIDRVEKETGISPTRIKFDFYESFLYFEILFQFVGNPISFRIST